MNDKQVEKLMKVLIGISAFLILAGALFKLQHYQNGNLILYIGFWTFFILSVYENNRLRRIIKKMETQNSDNA